ncbi:MAG TPA: hypothetical protein VFL91_27590 [Thermomicrobiales bacterium]|nr:hypothetical protein [Thermomicrobiales bacterium]
MTISYRLIEQQPEPAPAGGPADHAALERRRDALSRRLELGYRKIERGLEDGQDVTTWEDLWITLLREYEQICDDLERELAA